MNKIEKMIRKMSLSDGVEYIRIEEVTNDNIYKNCEEAKIHIKNYIKNWYNNKRIYSSIGYKI